MDPLQTRCPYDAVAAAIGALLHPHAEVVVHDLSSGRIAAIWNPHSGRRVGDESLLDSQPGGEGDGPVWGPYEKTGPRGERLKSVTAALPGPEGGAPTSLLCINLDVSHLDAALRVLSAFVSPPQPQPVSLFRADWREQIQTVLFDWLRDAGGASVRSLSRDQRTALVGHLDARGLFEARGAADHAAALLGVARTSFYNYLRAARAGAASAEQAA
jgi:predicted transcriptional regulator YheO